jgi:hypothetical protein
MLTGLLADVAEGRLTAFEPEVIPFDAVWAAHRAADQRVAGRTVVLEM